MLSVNLQVKKNHQQEGKEGCCLFPSISLLTYLLQYIVEEKDCAVNSGMPQNHLDEFTSKLTTDDARVIIDLLKLAVSNRCGAGTRAMDVISGVLLSISQTNAQVAEMLLELCVTELEDIATDTRPLQGSSALPVVQESSHPYTDDVVLSGHIRIPGAEALKLEFDRQCSTERRHDPLTIMDGSGRVIATRSGREWSEWATEIRITGDELRWKFISDSTLNGWGWRFTAFPIIAPVPGHQEMLSDRTVLSHHSLKLVMCLLDSEKINLDMCMDHNIAPRLATALAACAQLSTLGESPFFICLHQPGEM